MEFEKYIGQNFDNISHKIGQYSIERNDFELKLEEGLEERFFVHSIDGSFQMILEKNRSVRTIFLFPVQDGSFHLGNFNVNMGRKEIREIMGLPDKEKDAFNDPVLGKNGGFDRYDKHIIYHFEYEDFEQKKLKQITLMSREFIA